MKRGVWGNSHAAILLCQTHHPQQKNRHGGNWILHTFLLVCLLRIQKTYLNGYGDFVNTKIVYLSELIENKAGIMCRLKRLRHKSGQLSFPGHLKKECCLCELSEIQS